MAEDYVGAIRESRITYGVPRIPLRMRRPDRGTVVHSDQGSQYASFDYQRLLTAHGLVCSMSRKGHCSDNAVVESFFHTIKTEPVGFEDYHTWDQARTSLFEYIEVFYNRLRRHSTPNYRSPVQFETVNMSPYPVSEISGQVPGDPRRDPQGDIHTTYCLRCLIICISFIAAVSRNGMIHRSINMVRPD